jgi:hypothetical protein
MTAEWLTGLDAGAIEALARVVGERPPLGSVSVMHAGGAAGRPGAGCAPRLPDSLLFRAVAPAPDADARRVAAARLAELRHRLAGVSSGRTQLDLCDPAERPSRLVAAYGVDTLDRLRRVRAMLDSEHLLDGGCVPATGVPRTC